MAQLYSVRSRELLGRRRLRRPRRPGRRSRASAGRTSCSSTPCTPPRSPRPSSRRPYLPATRRFLAPLYVRPGGHPRGGVPRRTADRARLDGASRAGGSGRHGRRAHRPRRVVGGETGRAGAHLRRAAVAGAAGPARRLRRARGAAAAGLRAVVRPRGALRRDARRRARSARPRPGTSRRRSWRELREQLRAADRSSTSGCSGSSTSSWPPRSPPRRRRACASAIMHDLAVGVHTRGSDAWSLRDMYASGITVGAPPDMYNQQGQNWNQPPWLPHALAESGYAPLRDMIRTLLRNAGALRIDHVIGLFRLWWIPGGSRRGGGHLRALRPRGDDRRARPRGAPRRRRRDRRRPGQRRAVGARLPVLRAGSWAPPCSGSSTRTTASSRRSTIGARCSRR